MDTIPTTDFDLERVRDLTGRSSHVWYRRAALVAIAAFVVAALAGALGQVSRTRTAAGPAATISVRMAKTIRGGLLVPARVTIHARQKIVSPQVVLGSGFVKGMQVNTLEPSATSETTRPATGRGAPASLALTYPTLEAGDDLTVYLQLQVDPTTVGRQDTSVSIEGANARPVRSPASVLVLP